MSRYIDADALTAEFKRLTLGENSLIERVFADGVYAVIDTFPTADAVEVRHARWIEESSLYVHCSVCRTMEYPREHNFKSKFCPECGAKMDEERKE